MLFILLVMSATLLGGLYGALYDQLTYSICSEFYTKMRFPQYGIEGNVNERWEVAKIGFRNTWSVGFGFGFFLSLAGQLHTSNRKMVATTFQSFAIALFSGLLFGIFAYFFSKSTADISIEINVVDKLAFNKVSCMNNYSYVGGMIGMFLGLAWQVIRLKKI